MRSRVICQGYNGGDEVFPLNSKVTQKCPVLLLSFKFVEALTNTKEKKEMKNTYLKRKFVIICR